MKCPGCGGGYRKGTIVLLLDPKTATVERKRVCPTCVRNGFSVAAVQQPTIVKENVFTGGAAYNAEVIGQLRVLARAANLMSKTDPIKLDPTAVMFHQGRAEGFEGAIELLRRREKQSRGGSA